MTRMEQIEQSESLKQSRTRRMRWANCAFSFVKEEPKTSDVAGQGL
jgi:hypothetical protein